MKRPLIAALTVLAVLASAFGGTQAAAADGWVVVASNLDNPRGLDYVSDVLYVAEAGRGGTGPCGIGAGGEFVCYGPTGAITRVKDGKQRRIVTGLPSLAGPMGIAATGPHDVSIWNHRAFIPVGFGGSPAQRAAFAPVGPLLGTLVWASLAPSGMWRVAGDFVTFEGTFNPDGGDINGNPNAALALPGHRYVVDAGANTLLDLRNEGRPDVAASVQLLKVFPPQLAPAPPFLGLPPGTMIPMESVPTSITRGPDGALYVGELTGFPFQVDGARVYRIVPGSVGPPTVYASGFTTIMDVAFGEDDSLYVLEYKTNGFLSPDPTGALIRVAPDGTRTTIASTGLVTPGGLAIHEDWAFVSNNSISPGAGEVVRIPLD